MNIFETIASKFGTNETTKSLFRVVIGIDLRASRSVLVPLRNKQIDKEVDQADNGKKQVEQV